MEHRIAGLVEGLRQRRGPHAVEALLQTIAELVLWLNEQGHGTVELAAKDGVFAEQFKVITIRRPGRLMREVRS